MIAVPETGFSIEVVIPLRDMQEHVEACLRPLLEQCRYGDVVTVVDDGSSDSTPHLAAELGARVIRLSQSQGPYAGRHLAAERSSADALLFVDGRSRAKPGLLDSHRRQLGEPGVALSCTEVAVLPGSTFAGRIACEQKIFSLDKYIGIPGRLDYFPTCNLGVLREAYLSVGGFRRMRSGGDADLCWRIQNARLGRLTFDDKTLMAWIPRESVRELADQWRRYGQSAGTLSVMYPREEIGGPGKIDHARRKNRTVRLLRQARRDFLATLMLVILEIIMRKAAADTKRRPPAPDDFSLLGQISTSTRKDSPS